MNKITNNEYRFVKKNTPWLHSSHTHYTLLTHTLHTAHISEYLQMLVSMPMSLHSMEGENFSFIIIISFQYKCQCRCPRRSIIWKVKIYPSFYHYFFTCKCQCRCPLRISKTFCVVNVPHATTQNVQWLSIKCMAQQ